MSAKLKEFGCINSFDEIFDFLSWQKNENELKNYFASISGYGDLICFGYECKLLIASLKYDIHSKNSDSAKLTINSKIFVVDEYTEECVSSVLVIPIASQKQSSQGFPDWNCVCVGLTSGFLQFYDQNGQLLFSQKFHDSRVDQIKLQSYPSYNVIDSISENLMVLCGNCCFQVDGYHLYESLNMFKRQLARTHAGFKDQETELFQLSYKKWLIDSQESVIDIIFGYETRDVVLDNIFLYASNKGPFATIPDNNSKYINCTIVGKNPFLVFYRLPLESDSLDIGDLAQAVYSKVRGAISSSFSSWLGSSKNTNKPTLKKSEVVSSDVPSRLQNRHSIEENSRKATKIVGCPQYNKYSRLSAITDDFGRIFLVDIDEGVIIRIWKGYRDAQISISTSSNERNVNYLIIYAPRRALIEIWTIPFGERVASFDIKDHNGRIFNVPHTLLGLSRCHKNHQKLKHCHSTFFLDSTGKISILEIPFHLSLVSSNNERSQDHLVLKHFKNFLKDQVSACDVAGIQKEFFITAHHLKLAGSLDLLIDNIAYLPQFSVEFLLSIFTELIDQLNTESLIHSSSENDRLRVKIRCKEMFSLLNCYKKLSEMSENTDISTDEQNLEILLNLETDDCDRTQKIFKIYCQFHNSDRNRPPINQNYHLFINNFIPESNNSEISIGFQLEKHVLNKEITNIGCMMFGKCVTGEHKIETVLDLVVNDTKIDKISSFKICMTYLIHESAEVIMKNLSRIKHLLSSILSRVDMEMNSSSIAEIHKFFQSCFSIAYEICEKSSDLMTSLLLAMIIRVIIFDFTGSLQCNDSSKLFVYLTESILSWTDTCQRLEDLSIFDCFLKCRPMKSLLTPSKKYKVSFDRDLTLVYVLENGRGIFSESFAKWAFKWNLKFADIHELYKSLGNDQENVVQNSNLNPEIQEIFTILYKQLPHALEYDSVLINVCWEYTRHWSKNIQRVEYLHCASDLLESVGPAAGLAIQGIGRMMWDMHIKTHLESFFLTKSKNDSSKYSLKVQLDITTNAIKFLQTLLKSLDNLDVIPTFCSESVWQGDKSRTSLIDLAVSKESISVTSVELHSQLMYAYQLVISVKEQSFNCLTLYSSETRKYFFDCLTTTVPSDLIQSDISQCKIHRMRFLDRIISQYMVLFSEGSEKNIHDQIEKIIKLLGEKWQLDLDDIRQCWIVKYYEHGLDSQGSMYLDKVRNTTLLATNLLRIVGLRIKKRYLNQKSKNYHEYSKYVTPQLNKWFQSLDNVSIKSASFQTTSVLIDQIIEWLPETSNDLEPATCLQSLILNIENTRKYLPE